MSAMKKFLHLPLTAAILIMLLAGYAYPEQIQGKLKSLAEDAKVFTIEASQGEVLFITYNKETQCGNIESLTELEQDDFVSVEFSRKGDQITATFVTKAVITLPPGFNIVTTEKLAGNLDQSGKELPFILIDPRPVQNFDAAHLPGAVSIPLSRLKKQSTELLPVNKNTQLLFYDQGAGGTEAANSAELARKAGFINIAVYVDGVTGWLRSGRFAASSSAFIRKTRPVLLDLRDEEIVAGGHLKGAVNIPAKKLPEMLEIFPIDKRAPIVIYGDNNQQAVSAARIIRDWGYKNVTIYPGGTTAWVDSAEALSTEPTEKYMKSAGSTHSGRLGANDFEMALNSPIMVEIVDLRDSSDFKKGSFPASKHIPLQELPIRHNELSKDKFQVVFGADEQHAEMAFDFLSPLGYRVNYLKGSVVFSSDQKYQIK